MEKLRTQLKYFSSMLNPNVVQSNKMRNISFFLTFKKIYAQMLKLILCTKKGSIQQPIKTNSFTQFQYPALESEAIRLIIRWLECSLPLKWCHGRIFFHAWMLAMYCIPFETKYLSD